MEERELIDRILRGEESAFEALVRKYQNYIFRLSVSLLKDEEEAKEMTQEVFIKVYTSISGFNRRSSLSTWIYRITYNLCLDHIKKHRKRQAVTQSLDDKENAEIIALHSDSDLPDEALERKELRRDIMEGLAALPQEQRVLIELKDVHGYSYEEILAITGLKDGTLKSRLFRGRLALKKYLSEKWNLTQESSSKITKNTEKGKEDL